MRTLAATRLSIKRHLLVGVGLTASLTAGAALWATTTEVAGAVIAPGTLVVDSSVKKVQHPTGGVVGELAVREGDRVKAGQVLVRLDATQTRSNLAIVTKALDELAAREARDIAERDGAATIVFPADLLVRKPNDGVLAGAMNGEERLFAIRRSARDGQREQLQERVGQLRQEIEGLTEQAAAKAVEIRFVVEELDGVRQLYGRNLVQITRLTALERDSARTGGERGQLVSQIAQVKGRITEVELRIRQIDQDLRSEVAKDLSDIRGKSSELEEKRVGAEDLLKRIDIRSPQDGVVHQMMVHTVGGLVTPVEPIMLIVPEADELTVEVRIQPHDIEHVRVGKAASLRFTALNQRTTPEVTGRVVRVSADVTTDPKTNTTFYTARIGFSRDQFARADEVRLIPGMPVEAFVQTVPRTVVSYLMTPIVDQLNMAFRN